MKYSVGDYVKVTLPKDITEYPGVTLDMIEIVNKSLDKRFKIKQVLHDTYFLDLSSTHFHSSHFSWSEKWLSHPRIYSTGGNV